MRQSADGKRVLVDGAGVTEKPRDEVAAAYVMGQVAEKLFAEGVVAPVLDGRAAVGIGVSFAQLRLRRAREAGKQHGANRIVPRQVNQFLMGKNRIAGGTCSAKDHHQ